VKLEESESAGAGNSSDYNIVMGELEAKVIRLEKELGEVGGGAGRDGSSGGPSDASTTLALQQR